MLLIKLKPRRETLMGQKSFCHCWHYRWVKYVIIILYFLSPFLVTHNQMFNLIN